MATITPLNDPSRIFHGVCAYKLTSSEGFRAKADGTANSAPRIEIESATAFRCGIRANCITHSSYLTYYGEPCKYRKSDYEYHIGVMRWWHDLVSRIVPDGGMYSRSRLTHSSGMMPGKAALLVLWTSAAFAQTVAGVIQGQIVDSSGAA